MLLRRVVEAPPQQQPQQAQHSWNDERGTPAPVRVDVEREKWCDRSAYRGPAIKQRCGEASLAGGEPLGNSLGRSRPVRGLTQSQHEAEPEESEQAVRQRSEDRHNRVERN